MIEENIRKIKERVALACSRVDRDPAAITIVAVSKGRSVQEIEEAAAAGITGIGENRIQEAALKYKELTGAQIKWHLVGHLQTNKAKDAVKIFDLIQSVDSPHLAVEIDKEAAKINKVQDILIQVNTSGEVTKFGLKPDAAVEVIKEITGLKNISIKGLMAIAPLSDNPEQTRPYFRALRELRDKLVQLWTVDCGLWTLSMGMTDDFEVAIEEGATMLRLGRALFES
jgi:hypothetical protein